MIATERANYILNRLRQKEIVGLKEISAALDISEATARRDIDRLDQLGYATRVRGGVARRYQALPAAPGHVEDDEELKACKLAVAQLAAGFVKDGECVFLDSGTTIAPLIDYIQDKKIKVVTHNMLVPQQLHSRSVELYFLGGNYNQYHKCTMGVHTEKLASQFHFDHAFFGCSGIDLARQTAYNEDIETVPVKEVAMRCANHSYLLADASKLGKPGFCRFAGLDAFECVIVSKPWQEMTLPANFRIAAL